MARHKQVIPVCHFPFLKSAVDYFPLLLLIFCSSFSHCLLHSLSLQLTVRFILFFIHFIVLYFLFLSFVPLYSIATLPVCSSPSSSLPPLLNHLSPPQFLSSCSRLSHPLLSIHYLLFCVVIDLVFFLIIFIIFLSLSLSLSSSPASFFSLFSISSSSFFRQVFSRLPPTPSPPSPDRLIARSSWPTGLSTYSITYTPSEARRPSSGLSHTSARGSQAVSTSTL